MSLNMFPHAGEPSFTEGMEDRTLPRGPAEGPGPYGSYNTKAKPDPGDLEHPPIRNLEMDDMDHPPKYATVTEELFSEDDTQAILDEALERAYLLMNPILAQAIKQQTPIGLFNELATAKADDLLETCVYEELTDRDLGFNLRALTPVGLVEFIDYFMTRQSGRVAQLEERLKQAYLEYWSSKTQKG